MLDAYAKDRALRHFYHRALERHGLTICKNTAQSITNQIHNKEAEFLRWSEGEGFRSFYQAPP